MENFKIEPLYDQYRPWASKMLREWWSSTRIVSRGKMHQADTLPGFVALRDEAPVGFITCNLEGRQCECEIVSLNSIQEGKGIGRALVNAVIREAEKSGCRRVWLITTNDNLAAVRFYQRIGFRMVAVHQNAIEESRKLKPEIPAIGFDGIPIRDEIELEMRL